jgi:SAM-dependent methyltransferase
VAFDLVITQDFFEHVLRPAKAFTGIARTLKPGGALIYTVPYDLGKNGRPSRPNGMEGITHLMKPDYHGNPTAGFLLITEWGDELCDFVFRSSGITPTILDFHDPRLGLKGEFLDVLISRKTSTAHLLAEPGGHQVGAEIP